MDILLNYNLWIMLIGLIVISMSSLALIKFFKERHVLLGKMTAFTSGITLLITIKEIYPDTIELSGEKSAFFLCIVGILIMILMHYVLSIVNEPKSSFNSFFIILIGLLVHKIPEGIIMGIAVHAFSIESIKVIIVLFLHSVLEIIMIGMPMIKQGFNDLKMMKYILIINFSTAIGIFLAFIVSSNYIIGSGLGISAGFMLFISIYDMPKEAIEIIGKKLTLKYIIIGVVMGIVIV